jgi:hypothetical protein
MGANADDYSLTGLSLGKYGVMHPRVDDAATLQFVDHPHVLGSIRRAIRHEVDEGDLGRCGWVCDAKGAQPSRQPIPAVGIVLEQRQRRITLKVFGHRVPLARHLCFGDFVSSREAGVQHQDDDRRGAHRSHPRADERIEPEFMALVLQGRSVIGMDVKVGNGFGPEVQKVVGRYHYRVSFLAVQLPSAQAKSWHALR